jgi:hypothetical protein
MNESAVKRQMAKDITDHGGYARRFEDQYAVGTFDMILIPKGLPVFFSEVKIIRANFFGPTPRQQIELARISEVSGDALHVIPVMIGWKDRTFYFHPPQSKINYTDCFSVTTSDMSFHDQLVKYYHFIKGQP